MPDVAVLLCNRALRGALPFPTRVLRNVSMRAAGACLHPRIRSTILNVVGTLHAVSLARSRSHWLVLIIHGSVRYRQSEFRIR